MVKKKNKILSILMAFMILFSTIITTTIAEADTSEKSLSEKTWESSMTAILKSKDGTSYEDAGHCTGYVCWAIQQSGLYNISDWPDNMPVGTLEQRLVDLGVTRVSVSDAKAGDIVFFGDKHVAILGADGMLHHNTTSKGVMSGTHTIEWWVENGGNKAGNATVYRGFKQEISVEITINKISADKVFTDGNACYSLMGAKYGVYNGNTLLKTLTANEAGVAKASISVMPDAAKNLTIKELSPSSGYGKDTTVYKADGSSGKVTITSKEPPAGDPATVLLYKADSETGKFLNAGELKEYYPQKAGSLAGAIFEVKFYGVKKSDLDGAKELRTWYVETDENGYVRLGEKWLADGYKQSDFYTDASTGMITFPLGTVTIQEIVAPEGYHLNDDLFVSSITQTGENVIVNTYQEPIIKDQIKRGDFDFMKAADDTQKRLANVPFLITALEEDGMESENGESHIIVTDSNGYASTSGSFNAHSNKTNANDTAWNGTELDESKLDSEAGIWFGDIAALKDSKGALPYGKYRLDELPCKANDGYKLIEGLVATVTRDGYTIELGTLTDKQNEIITSVWDSDLNEERISLARNNITLTDRVSMKGMEKGESYTLEGTIMDKETGEMLKIDGKTVTAEKTFNASGTSCTVDVDFTFDASSLAGKEIVVFQKLIKDGVTITSHEDIDNPDQTITFLNPSIKTTATGPELGINYSFANEKTTIVDRIKYSNILRGGYTYEMVGYLMDKETGKPVMIDGKEVTVSKAFTSNKTNGSIEMEFNFDATSMQGKDVVVFEELYFDGELIAEHKDIDDEGQTIHFPEVKTEAKDSETEDHISYADDKVAVIDTVSYKNVKPDEEYEVQGSLIDKDTGDALAEASASFTAEKTDGEIEVTFEFDGKGLAGKDAVVYENLLIKDKVIASHTDINDKKQTIHFPEIRTKASDLDSGKQNVVYENGKEITIVDTVNYKNLIKGKEYRISGILMDKKCGKPLPAQETGKEGITGEKTFTAEKQNGEIEVRFTLDISDLRNKSIVVFEKLYLEDEIIAVHEDIEDKDQTVTINPQPVKAVKTGDDMNIWLWAGLAAAAVAVSSAAMIRRRKKDSDITK